MELYVIQTSKVIIQKHFNMEVEVELDKYESFLNEKRRKEIKKYIEYGIISPQIYNICYFILTREMNMDKEKVKSKFQKDVDEIKKDIRTIQILRYTPEEYKQSKEKERIVIKSSKPNIDGVNWDIPEYEIVRGDWNSTRV